MRLRQLSGGAEMSSARRVAALGFALALACSNDSGHSGAARVTVVVRASPGADLARDPVFGPGVVRVARRLRDELVVEVDRGRTNRLRVEWPGACPAETPLEGAEPLVVVL